MPTRATRPRSPTPAGTGSPCRCRRPCATPEQGPRRCAGSSSATSRSSSVPPEPEHRFAGRRSGRSTWSRTRTCSATAPRSPRSVGCATSGRSTATVEEIDGRGLCALPGLVDCHTHACFAGDRVDEFALRATGASYEELHAAGGGIISTVRATRAAGEQALADAVEQHRRVDARGRDDHVRGEVRLRPRP